MPPMLDEGRVKDRKTDRAVSQTIVFFTSNLITEVPRENPGNQNALRNLVFNARLLRQEFVARIGQIVPLFGFSPEESRIARLDVPVLFGLATDQCLDVFPWEQAGTLTWSFGTRRSKRVDNRLKHQPEGAQISNAAEDAEAASRSRFGQGSPSGRSPYGSQSPTAAT